MSKLPENIHRKLEAIHAKLPKGSEAEYMKAALESITNDPELFILINNKPLNDPVRSGIYGFFGNKKPRIKENGKNGNHNGNEQLDFANLPRRIEHYVKNPPGALVYIPKELFDNGQSKKFSDLEKKIVELEKQNTQLKQENDDLREKLMRLIFIKPK